MSHDCMVVFVWGVTSEMMMQSEAVHDGLLYSTIYTWLLNNVPENSNLTQQTTDTMILFYKSIQIPYQCISPVVVHISPCGHVGPVFLIALQQMIAIIICCFGECLSSTCVHPFYGLILLNTKMLTFLYFTQGVNM